MPRIRLQVAPRRGRRFESWIAGAAVLAGFLILCGTFGPKRSAGDSAVVSTATPRPTATTRPTQAVAPTWTPRPTVPTWTPLPPNIGFRGGTDEAPLYFDDRREVDPPWYPCKKGQIKGNTDSMLYHTPTGAYYDKTFDGVACFDNSEAAQAAGYSAAQR